MDLLNEQKLRRLIHEIEEEAVDDSDPDYPKGGYIVYTDKVLKKIEDCRLSPAALAAAGLAGWAVVEEFKKNFRSEATDELLARLESAHSAALDKYRETVDRAEKWNQQQAVIKKLQRQFAKSTEELEKDVRITEEDWRRVFMAHAEVDKDDELIDEAFADIAGEVTGMKQRLGERRARAEVEGPEGETDEKKRG